MSYARLSQFTVPAPDLATCVKYAEDEIRPAFDELPGNLGFSLLADQEAGAVYGSFWASDWALGENADADAAARGELTRQASEPVTTEDYEIVTFEREGSLRAGQAVRLTRVQVTPTALSDVIDVIDDSAVPETAEAPDFRGALVFADWESGRLLSETLWRTPSARSAGPSVARVIRANVLPTAQCEVQAIADYTVLACSVWEPFGPRRRGR